MKDLAATLESILDSGYRRLSAIREEDASLPPAPGKWSPKEVIGHLVDSAVNNHGRFVRAQLEDDLIFPGYDQDAWVKLQRYNDRPWAGLIGLWRDLNVHIARLVREIPQESLSRQRFRHNLDRIAWRTVPADKLVTLEYFIADYIAHLEHHLAQIE